MAMAEHPNFSTSSALAEFCNSGLPIDGDQATPDPKANFAQFLFGIANGLRDLPTLTPDLHGLPQLLKDHQALGAKLQDRELEEEMSRNKLKLAELTQGIGFLQEEVNGVEEEINQCTDQMLEFVKGFLEHRDRIQGELTGNQELVGIFSKSLELSVNKYGNLDKAQALLAGLEGYVKLKKWAQHCALKKHECVDKPDQFNPQNFNVSDPRALDYYKKYYKNQGQFNAKFGLVPLIGQGLICLPAMVNLAPWQIRDKLYGVIVVAFCFYARFFIIYQIEKNKLAGSLGNRMNGIDMDPCIPENLIYQFEKDTEGSIKNLNDHIKTLPSIEQKLKRHQQLITQFSKIYGVLLKLEDADLDPLGCYQLTNNEVFGADDELQTLRKNFNPELVASLKYLKIKLFELQQAIKEKEVELGVLKASLQEGEVNLQAIQTGFVQMEGGVFGLDNKASGLRKKIATLFSDATLKFLSSENQASFKNPQEVLNAFVDSNSFYSAAHLAQWLSDVYLTLVAFEPGDFKDNNKYVIRLDDGEQKGYALIIKHPFDVAPGMNATRLLFDQEGEFLNLEVWQVSQEQTAALSLLGEVDGRPENQAGSSSPTEEIYVPAVYASMMNCIDRFQQGFVQFVKDKASQGTSKEAPKSSTLYAVEGLTAETSPVSINCLHKLKPLFKEGAWKTVQDFLIISQDANSLGKRPRLHQLAVSLCAARVAAQLNDGAISSSGNGSHEGVIALDPDVIAALGPFKSKLRIKSEQGNINSANAANVFLEYSNGVWQVKDVKPAYLPAAS